MSNDIQAPSIFGYGSTWIRADFHLHTNADKEFKYTDNEDDYFSNYVKGLEKADIRIGVITNHNKFDESDYQALRKMAKRRDICLLPGVELAVDDGSNGVHTLIVFGDQWLENGNDYISPIITTLFCGKTESEYQNENGRSDKNILHVVEELEKTGRDYFLIFAHVAQRSGLWHAMGDFKDKRYETVRCRTLGFQQVRTDDKSDRVCRTQIKSWFGDWYPAEVEGSDCKSIAEIGSGRSCYLKLGALSFDAVKFALIDNKNRISQEPIHHKHSHIRSIRFTGNTLKDQELYFSPELNTLIGIRGSGKSSVLEVIRYALEIPFGEKTGDQEYKRKLVEFTLGSGGKVEIDAIDRCGRQYTIRRVWQENYSEVLIDGKLQPGVSIRGTVLRKPIYFGQKDLSNTGEGFEKDLVDKLLGSKLDDVRQNIFHKKQAVAEAVDRLLNSSHVHEQMAEQETIRQDSEHRLNFYKEHGIEEKLQKRLDFDSDVRMMSRGVQLAANFVSDLESLLAQHEDDLRNFCGYQSKHNDELFKRFYQQYDSYISLIDSVKRWLTSERTTKQALLDSQSELSEIRKGMVEEFAEIERKLAEELKGNGSQNISSDEFLMLKKRLTIATQMISALKKQSDQNRNLQQRLWVELQHLNALWLQEFNLIKDELDNIGTASSSLSILSGYKEDKAAFLSFMKDIFKGSGIRETTYHGLVEQYVDFVAIYKDLENAKQLCGSNPQSLTELFLKHLKTLLTYQTPNKFTIIYRGKELQHHSLGQRASALILFVLSQKENDVIIIDQPEDDLDNQTIYEDVIKLIRKMKPEVQFIFATHNPNIPVLGDAELVHACSFMDDKESVYSGSVDNHETQKTIVKIMEGGKEAFDRRKEIYQIWKS
ncbi:histidinol-phosphatase [Ectothiorhodospiraceae bacterium BW-2]|nr:histidinol-phosphatase [Ectothiorhodospiraceae bacterium BW-2]